MSGALKWEQDNAGSCLLSLASDGVIDYSAGRMRPRLISALTVVSLIAGCAYTSTSTTTTTGVLGEPTVEIDPAIFLYDVPCAAVPGGMQSYVATFFDLGPVDWVQDDDNRIYPLQLPSSPPTRCSQPVRLAYAATGHQYVVAIDGYQQAPDELASTCSIKPHHATCVGEASSAPLAGGLCTSDSDCVLVGANPCQGTCEMQSLEVQGPGGTCEIVHEKGKNTPILVKACDYSSCASVPKACVGDVKRAPEGAGFCSRDADCFAAGCYGRCISQALQHKDSSGACAVVPDATISVCRYDPTPGDRHMVDPKTFASISPRWTSPPDEPCGVDDPAVPADYQTAEIFACGPLDDLGPMSPTGVRVEPAAAIVPPDSGELTCGVIARFEVKPTDPSLAAQGVSCSVDASVSYQGLVPAQEYGFTVEAYEGSEAAPSQAAWCVAKTVAGLIVHAVCDPLAPIEP